VLLQVDPEEHGIIYELLDGNSHGLQLRKREEFRTLPFPSFRPGDLPVFGFYPVGDLFRVIEILYKIIWI
jgi:hypothetical protein